MDWLNRMNRAVDYIESNLDGEIDYGRAAQIAMCSVYQFQRIFSFVLEIPLSACVK